MGAHVALVPGGGKPPKGRWADLEECQEIQDDEEEEENEDEGFSLSAREKKKRKAGIKKKGNKKARVSDNPGGVAESHSSMLVDDGGCDVVDASAQALNTNRTNTETNASSSASGGPVTPTPEFVASVRRRLKQLRVSIAQHQLDPADSEISDAPYQWALTRRKELHESIRPKKSLDQLTQSAKDRRKIVSGKLEAAKSGLLEV